MGTNTIAWVKTLIMASFGALSVALAAPAYADPDIDFATELHSYGIYGARDYNAWIGKLSCKRMETGLDSDAYKSANYVKTNIDRTSSTQQVYDFLGAAIRTYCPEQQYRLDQIAGKPAPAPINLGEALPSDQR